MQLDNVKLIEEFNALKYENKKIKNHQRQIESFMEFVLGPENFTRMLGSIENNAIMGRAKNFKNKTKHKRKSSGQPPRPPRLGGDGAGGSQTTRNFDPKQFKIILEEFSKNSQNALDQDKIMEDIQRKMQDIGKEFNIKKGLNTDLNFDSNYNTVQPGSQSHRLMGTSNTPTSTNISNFIPTSGRSSEIRAQAKIEADLPSVPTHSRKHSLPSIAENPGN